MSPRGMSEAAKLTRRVSFEVGQFCIFAPKGQPYVSLGQRPRSRNCIKNGSSLKKTARDSRSRKFVFGTDPTNSPSSTSRRTSWSHKGSLELPSSILTSPFGMPYAVSTDQPLIETYLPFSPSFSDQNRPAILCFTRRRTGA